MSQYIDDCNDPQGIETIFKQLIWIDDDGNAYVNIVDSGLTEADVTPITDCTDFRTALQLFLLSIGIDNAGNPAIKTISIA